jgi:predicted transcriptional regulator
LADVVLLNRKEIEKVQEKEKEYTKVISNLWKKLRLLMDERQRKHKNKMVEIEVQKNRVIDDVNYRIERLRNQVEQLREKS